MSENCIFCSIINGAVPSKTIYEDAEFKVFFDAFPSSPGHTLIVPKAHVADVFELDETQGARIFQLATRVAKALKKTLNCEGMNILQNNGKVAGQTVYHFHIHIIPRYERDDVRIGWKTTTTGPEEQERLHTLLVNHLQ